MRPRDPTPHPGRRLAATAALLAALGGCVVTHGDDYPDVIRRPDGERITFWLRASEPDGPTPTVEGELLEVKADGFLVASDSGFVFLPAHQVVAPAMEDPSAYRFRARYPYGLDDGRLTRLMREAGVERVDSAALQ